MYELDVHQKHPLQFLPWYNSLMAHFFFMWQNKSALISTQFDEWGPLRFQVITLMWTKSSDFHIQFLYDSFRALSIRVKKAICLMLWIECSYVPWQNWLSWQRSKLRYLITSLVYAIIRLIIPTTGIGCSNYFSSGLLKMEGLLSDCKWLAVSKDETQMS